MLCLSTKKNINHVLYIHVIFDVSGIYTCNYKKAGNNWKSVKFNPPNGETHSHVGWLFLQRISSLHNLESWMAFLYSKSGKSEKIEERKN